MVKNGWAKYGFGEHAKVPFIVAWSPFRWKTRSKEPVAPRTAALDPASEALTPACDGAELIAGTRIEGLGRDGEDLAMYDP